jgi:hypothetical protein
MRIAKFQCQKCQAYLSRDGTCAPCEKRRANVESVQKWRVENEEHYRETKRNHYLNNKEQYAERVKKRRAALDERTPKWLSESQLEQIQAFYKKAKRIKKLTGVDYHVDHIVPLQGDKVSGLNVPWNLQLLTADQNDGKGIKFDHDDPNNIGAGMEYIPEPPARRGELISFDANEVPLTYQEESFCANYIRYGDVRYAYKIAFDKAPTRDEINRLSADFRILNRVTHIRSVMRESTEFTATEHLMNMAMLRDQAVKKGDMKAAIQAEKYRGEVAGFYAGKTSLLGDSGGVQIVANLLPQIEGLNFKDDDSGVTISEPKDGLSIG